MFFRISFFSCLVIAYCDEGIGIDEELDFVNHIDPIQPESMSNWPHPREPFTDTRLIGQNGTIILRAPTVNNTIAEKIVESPNLQVNENYTNAFNKSGPELAALIKSPERNSVVDWFFGLVGRPTEPVTVPSEDISISTSGCSYCKCGQTFKNIRIVGGIETMVNEYPWMTALLYNNRFYCGGSLINNLFVMTAAHCVNGFSKDKISAVFLDHDRSTTLETKTITRRIKNILRHRAYGSGGNYNNDIALLQIEQEVPFSGLLRPVCLPPIGKSFTGYEGIAVGWGATKEQGTVAQRLQEVRVPIMSNIECRQTGYGRRITDNMMCAGFKQGEKDSCQGDSGGPLHVQNGTFHQIVGVVSWGEGCAKPNYPGVYTRVNRFVSWIKSNTKDACYCST